MKPSAKYARITKNVLSAMAVAGLLALGVGILEAQGPAGANREPNGENF